MTNKLSREEKLYTFLKWAVIIGAILLFAYTLLKPKGQSQSIEQIRAVYEDSVKYYKDKLGKEIASKEVVIIEKDQLRSLDSAKYAELTARYKQLKYLTGSSTIDIRHDTVKLWLPSETYPEFSMGSIGLVEYQDSCLYAGFDFTDSGTYVNYLLASQSITSTFRRENGKTLNDVNISSPCGRIAQVKTFSFADPKKKWYQKPLVVGGIGLGAGLITGIIIAK